VRVEVRVGRAAFAEYQCRGMRLLKGLSE
jgi:hypothetical protein